MYKPESVPKGDLTDLDAEQLCPLRVHHVLPAAPWTLPLPLSVRPNHGD